MAELKKTIVTLTDEDYNTLYTQGSVTVGSVTVNYDPSHLYFTDKISSELIDDSGSIKKLVTYQTTAPTANIYDGGLHFVYLTTPPATRYSGYIYFIAE